MPIRFDSLTVRYNADHQPQLRTTIEKIIADHHRQVGNIQYVFCNSATSEKINREFLGHHYPTDIITFPYPEGDVVSAELWICKPQVRINALRFHQPFAVEMHRVIFHGILHMVGYDDHTPKDVSEMRRAENRYLDFFQGLLDGCASR